MDGINVMISGAQARMARAALRLPLPELAKKAGVAVNTIGRFEQGQGARMETVRKLVAAYQAEGVEFAPDGETVRFREIAA
jgi:transcriptional regulator with XRE-family HTH domain